MYSATSYVHWTHCAWWQSVLRVCLPWRRRCWRGKTVEMLWKVHNHQFEQQNSSITRIWRSGTVVLLPSTAARGWMAIVRSTSIIRTIDEESSKTNNTEKEVHYSLFSPLSLCAFVLFASKLLLSLFIYGIRYRLNSLYFAHFSPSQNLKFLLISDKYVILKAPIGRSGFSQFVSQSAAVSQSVHQSEQTISLFSLQQFVWLDRLSTLTIQLNGLFIKLNKSK